MAIDLSNAPWTAEQEDQAARLWTHGLTLSQIGEAVRLEEGVIRLWLRRPSFRERLAGLREEANGVLENRIRVTSLAGLDWVDDQIADEGCPPSLKAKLIGMVWKQEGSYRAQKIEVTSEGIEERDPREASERLRERLLGNVPEESQS